MSMNRVFLTLILVFALVFTTAESWICFDNGNFSDNSTYERNRDLVFSSLLLNTPRNGNFYAAVTIGEDPDKVYGLALCRADASPESCAACVEKSRQVLPQMCPNRKEVIGWEGFPPCIVHYANRPFFGILELTPTVPVLLSPRNLTSDLTQFDETWEGLMDDLANRAAAGSSLKFAAAQTQLTSSQTIYALMQCTPDLSPSDCGVCLRQTASDFRKCCRGNQGGYVRRLSCVMRWTLDPFYASLPPPAQNSSTTNPPATSKQKGVAFRTVIVVSTVGFVAVVVVVVLTCCALLRKRFKRKHHDIDGTDETDVEEIISAESLQFDFGTVRVATNNFSSYNKLGEGGFGVVYMGKLEDGQNIAVKRLSKNSGQGESEFKNEIIIMARLQHRYLVRLLGFCLEGNERLLVYEFVPNSSLDRFIFDPIKRLLLDWDVRYKIIVGIARGLLYLHEDSQYRIIHRDLKAANILLGAEMNPKISDFGMARLFAGDQSQAATRRIVGTYGYMAPEYIVNGKFSVKSDVYSFGVLVLEIISGKMIHFNNGDEGENLLSYAWKKWKDGTFLTNLMDPILRDGSRIEMMRCIHLGLLCVQENVSRRPTMDDVVIMLSSNSVSLQVPSKPAFFVFNSFVEADHEAATAPPARPPRTRLAEFSVNEANITHLEPR